MQAGASMKGEFEQRLRSVIDEVQASPVPIILFIDEIHTLIGAGGQAGTGDAANLLKPALARGTLRTIGATTWAEYRQYIEKDPALTRRFQPIDIDEPSIDKAIYMLRGLLLPMEKHHKVRISDAAVVAAVSLSHRYIPARQLPDKAVSLLDTACARVAISRDATRPPSRTCRSRSTPASKESSTALERRGRHRRGRRGLGELEAEVADIQRRATEGGSDEKALAEIETRHARRKGAGRRDPVPAREALNVQAEEAGATEATPSAATRGSSRTSRQAARSAIRPKPHGLSLRRRAGGGLGRRRLDRHSRSAAWSRTRSRPCCNLPEILNRRVVGQEHGLKMIAKRIETNRAKLDNPNKPIGVFMLCGPSGVGKTETALALAEALYGGEQNMITINMSEFQEAHTVSTLKGAPPGYVGYGEGGRLTEAVRRKPYSVVLLDEVEKAHPDVHELFFQVFDKGIMEDGNGRKINFKNTLIILTSNVGTEVIMKMAEEGRDTAGSRTLCSTRAMKPYLTQVFPPALLGRIVTIPYFPLSGDMLGGIVRLQLNRIRKRIAENHEAEFVYSDEVVEHIVVAVQRPGSRRAHDRQHHHQHAAAGTVSTTSVAASGAVKTCSMRVLVGRDSLREGSTSSPITAAWIAAPISGNRQPMASPIFPTATPSACASVADGSGSRQRRTWHGAARSRTSLGSVAPSGRTTHVPPSSARRSASDPTVKDWASSDFEAAPAIDGGRTRAKSVAARMAQRYGASPTWIKEWPRTRSPRISENNRDPLLRE